MDPLDPYVIPLCHMGGCEKNGPVLGSLNIRCRIIIGTQKGTMILTTTHIIYSTIIMVPIFFSPKP